MAFRSNCSRTEGKGRVVKGKEERRWKEQEKPQKPSALATGHHFLPLASCWADVHAFSKYLLSVYSELKRAEDEINNK